MHEAHDELLERSEYSKEGEQTTMRYQGQEQNTVERFLPGTFYMEKSVRVG